MTYRNTAVLREARNHPCQFCGNDDGTVVAAHSNQQRNGKGMGHKAADCFVAYLCSVCHSFVDQGSSSQLFKDLVWKDAHKGSIPLFRHLLGPDGQQLLDEDAS